MTTTPPMHDYQKAAIAALNRALIQSIPVQFFWPAQPRLRLYPVTVAIITRSK
jgi:hypothetical protein